ncbi:hypothetical protein G7054_g13287 [Neopestalotiopsis clavispora]|nr:hypothetical protein E8E14_002668 [Neopestalotiopsis sp. 37M]KAF7518907.1 hypothetical protein G7054_g13287 [Neopestalotiopsis clavispora]
MFRLSLRFLLVLVLVIITQAAAQVTTEIIVISVVNNVTVTQTDRVTTTETILRQTGDMTSTSKFPNITSTVASTGTGAMRPNATATFLPVQGQAVATGKQYGWRVTVTLVTAAFALLA